MNKKLICNIIIDYYYYILKENSTSAAICQQERGKGKTQTLNKLVCLFNDTMVSITDIRCHEDRHCMMRSLPKAPTHDQCRELNPRFLELWSSALPARPRDPSLNRLEKISYKSQADPANVRRNRIQSKLTKEAVEQPLPPTNINPNLTVCYVSKDTVI